MEKIKQTAKCYEKIYLKKKGFLWAIPVILINGLSKWHEVNPGFETTVFFDPDKNNGLAELTFQVNHWVYEDCPPGKGRGAEIKSSLSEFPAVIYDSTREPSNFHQK
jgi:hypothetical protein